MSAKRKQSAVLRLLRGEDLELLSRELSVPAAELSAWRNAFLAAGETSLKTRPADGRDAEMVRQGWALDYEEYSRGVYADEQRAAWAERAGIWAGEFVPPWEWRRVQR